MTENYDLQRFLDSKLLKRAACMTLINIGIGESVKALSEEVKHANQRVKWRFIAGLCDIAAHRYQTLRMERIWGTITDDVPKFVEQIKEILLTKEAEAEK